MNKKKAIVGLLIAAVLVALGLAASAGSASAGGSDHPGCTPRGSAVTSNFGGGSDCTPRPSHSWTPKPKPSKPPVNCHCKPRQTPHYSWYLHKWVCVPKHHLPSPTPTTTVPTSPPVTTPPTGDVPEAPAPQPVNHDLPVTG